MYGSDESESDSGISAGELCFEVNDSLDAKIHTARPDRHVQRPRGLRLSDDEDEMYSPQHARKPGVNLRLPRFF
jgi:hypothetical protein